MWISRKSDNENESETWQLENGEKKKTIKNIFLHLKRFHHELMEVLSLSLRVSNCLSTAKTTNSIIKGYKTQAVGKIDG